MAKTEVPNGWIQIRDPKTITERMRRPIIARASNMSALVDLADGEAPLSDVEKMLEFNDLVAVTMIAAWSFDGDVNVDTLLDLEVETYDAIQKKTSEYVSQLMPSFEVDPDPLVITESSEG